MALIKSCKSDGGAMIVSDGKYIECGRGTFDVKSYTKGTAFTISGEYIAEAIINVNGASTITASISAGSVALVGIKNDVETSINSGDSVAAFDYVIVQGSSGTTHTLTVTVS